MTTMDPEVGSIADDDFSDNLAFSEKSIRMGKCILEWHGGGDQAGDFQWVWKPGKGLEC